MVDCFDDLAEGSEGVSQHGGVAGLFALDVDGVGLCRLDAGGGLCCLVETGRAAGEVFASGAVCRGDAGGPCSLVEAGLAAGDLFALGAVWRGDASGLCCLVDVSEAGSLCSLDDDAATSSFSFSSTSKSRWIMLTALMPVFVRSGRAYHCLEVFSLCARTRCRMARSSGLQRSSISVVINFLISTNAIRDPRSTPHFSMNQESLLPMVPSRNPLPSCLVKRASSYGFAKSGRILRM